MIEKHWSTLEESHLFRKGLDSKYFWFCDPCGLCGNYSKTKINEHDCGPIKSLFAKGAVTFGQEAVVCWPLLYIIITSRSLEFNIVPLRPQLLMPLMTMVILKVKGIRILPPNHAILHESTGKPKISCDSIVILTVLQGLASLRRVGVGEHLRHNRRGRPQPLARHPPGEDHS